MTSFLSIAARRDVAARAFRTALVVGVVLIAINHADALIRGDVDLVLVAKMLLTFAVPYCVSTHASVGAFRSMETREG